jgi:putative glutamine amidotransferase
VSNAKPLIGVVAALYQRYGADIYGLRPAYTDAVLAAGGLPVLIVPNGDPTSLRAIYERVDGVLLAGGADIDPARYGMAGDGLVEQADNVRDSDEIALANWAYQEEKPLLGICRGMQMINVALGGSLYRDIGHEYTAGSPADHSLSGKFPRDHVGHGVKVSPDSALAQALGTASPLGVNSLHHEALRQVAAPLRVVAVADDGIVEGVEADPQQYKGRFFMGVQWHPEELAAKDEAMRALFAAFVNAVRAG